MKSDFAKAKATLTATEEEFVKNLAGVKIEETRVACESAYIGKKNGIDVDANKLEGKTNDDTEFKTVRETIANEKRTLLERLEKEKQEIKEKIEGINVWVNNTKNTIENAANDERESLDKKMDAIIATIKARAGEPNDDFDKFEKNKNNAPQTRATLLLSEKELWFLGLLLTDRRTTSSNSNTANMSSIVRSLLILKTRKHRKRKML